jgi:hypothetical protein
MPQPFHSSLLTTRAGAPGSPGGYHPGLLYSGLSGLMLLSFSVCMLHLCLSLCLSLFTLHFSLPGLAPLVVPGVITPGYYIAAFQALCFYPFQLACFASALASGFSLFTFHLNLPVFNRRCRLPCCLFQFFLHTLVFSFDGFKDISGFILTDLLCGLLLVLLLLLLLG